MLLLRLRMFCKIGTINCDSKNNCNCCCLEWGCLDEKQETAEGKKCWNTVALSNYKDVLTKYKNINLLRRGKVAMLLLKARMC